MKETQESLVRLAARVLLFALFVWAVAGFLLWAVESFRQGYVPRGHVHLLLWTGGRTYARIAPLFLAAAALLLALLLAVRRLAARRRAPALALLVVLSALLALLRLGYLLNRYGFTRFWKEARKSGAIPSAGAATEVLAGNAVLLLGVSLSGVILFLACRHLAGAGGRRPPLLLSPRATIPFLILPAIAFAGGTLLRPDPSGRPNVILLALDTTRLDHLTLAGYPRETAPNLTRLAQGGSLFAAARAQAPWTLSSFASLLTGLYPSTHGAYIATEERHLRKDYIPYLPKRRVLLAERFKEAGYRTFCEATNTYLRFGLEEGYDRCRVEIRPAGEVTDAMLDLLAERGDRPFFAFLHLNDAHMPNVAPPPFDDLFPTAAGRPHTNEEKWKWRYTSGERLDGGGFESYREHKIAIYDGCIRYMDDQIGRVLAWLDRRGLRERTLVVAVTDHGEEFWEHAAAERASYRDPRGIYGVGHGHTLFEEQTRMLLLLRGPGIPRGRIFPGAVREVDLAPTLLELAGLDVPGDIEGRSLTPVLGGREMDDRPALSEGIIFGSDRRSIVREGFKYVYSPDEPDLLFDLEADPGETRSLVSVDSARAAEMRGEIEAWIELHAGKGPDVRGAIDEKTRKELRALGYIE